MGRSLKINKSFILLAVIIPSMTLVSIFIYSEFIQTNKHVFDIIKKHLVNDKVQLFENYSNNIVKNYGQSIEQSICNNKIIEKKLEQELQLIQGDEIKYLYILYRDTDGKFRYLLDTTKDVEDKSHVKQKFDPQSDIWNNAYITKKVQITEQKDLETLWVSMAYPIVADDKVVAVIGADFTYSVYYMIKHTIKPMEKLFYYIAIFMMIMLGVAYSLVYMYYITRKKSFIDPLTRIYNRQYLSEFLDNNSLQDYYLMMIDLDNFKLVNDNYGHDAGDEVLINVVAEIKSNIRQKDILIRFGGEEFVILVYKKDVQDVLKVAQRIRKAVSQLNIHTQNNIIKMTLSIGINPFPYMANNIEEAIKIADEQLYIAKSSGRNRVEVYNSDNKYESQTSKRISDIQEAIDDNRVKCAFQPIYPNENQEELKYEVLLRLLDKDSKPIAPDSFLPFIKNTQVYISLTRYVIDTAINAMKENSFNFSINLDLQDILNDDIMHLLKHKFENAPELANRITIEILEHEEIKNFELIQTKLKLLKNMGFSIALDDFGSGYANFAYLINLDIDILKIDGTIIRDLDKNKSAYSIVKTICAFAKEMNMKVVAEQIETKEELEAVQTLGVDYLQGYYLGRPEFEFKDPFLR
ncbi:MAG: EAL domain-containing protein [Sulfurimonas sp.]